MGAGVLFLNTASPLTTGIWPYLSDIKQGNGTNGSFGAGESIFLERCIKVALIGAVGLERRPNMRL